MGCTSSIKMFTIITLKFDYLCSVPGLKEVGERGGGPSEEKWKKVYFIFNIFFVRS